MEENIVVSGEIGAVATVNGQKLTNLASFNFLGLLNDKDIKEKAISIQKEYGVGTCGPPGFYGTLDIHLQLESLLAKFLGAESAIIYSQAFSAVSSVVPAFLKKGDIIVYDDGINFALRKGIEISRSIAVPFKHNNMEDLERVLNQIVEKNKKEKLVRRFIIVEGLYQNFGDICPLPEIVNLNNCRYL